MRIEYSESGLYPENLDPEFHLELKRVVYDKYGTTNGIFSKIVIKGMEYILGLREGRYRKVDLVDSEASLLLTHISKPHQSHIKPSFFRKNQRLDLTRITLHKIPKKTYNTIINFVKEHFGTKYGVISYLVNEAIKLMIKIEKGFLEVMETDKKSSMSFISDDKGQINSIDSNSFFKFVEDFKSSIYELQSDIKEIKKHTFQSTLNIVPKAVGRVKKAVKGTVRSFKHEDKFDKALKVLEYLMKFKEFGFTDKEFHRTLVKLTGQGDSRTVRSDLDLLEADNRIKKVRNSAHGIKAYQFVENNQYHKYNSELAKNKFLEGFKKAFQDIDACTLDELNSFIFERDGLFDAQSQHKRLKWLLSDGCVKRHDVNPRLLFIQK